MEILPQKFRVPELYGDYWYNADPIPLSAQRGSIVLIDFWDYTNSASIRSVPYVREWHRRYADKGLITIGVHTPAFPFGRDPVNVRAAIDALEIRYPVVSDNDYIIWGAFRNQVWPTKYLVDKHGFIRYLHGGEGSYQNLEHALQSLLVEAGYHDELPIVMDPLREEDRPGVLLQRATGEVLASWQRGTIGNIEGYAPESTVHYEDRGYYLEGRLYLSGDWLSTRNYVKHEDQNGAEGSLTIVYHGIEAEAVINPEGEKNFQVFIRQDDGYLTAENKGSDIHIDEEGRSFFLVDVPKSYRLVKNREFGEHTIRLSARSNGFALYAMSFVSAVLPEVTVNS